MPDTELSLIEHLSELRKRIIYCLIPFLITSIFSAGLSKTILDFLRLPSRGIIRELAFFSPQEVATTYIKMAIYSGMVFSLPILLYQIWQFIAPALEARHKRYIFHFIFWVFLVFILGIGFGYFILVPVSLRFLLNLATEGLVPVISLGKYISFVLALVIGAGIVFQMPVLIWILSRFGLITAGLLRRKRKYAIAAVFIFAAIITPTTDPFTMCILALPMILLYEISILIIRQKTK